ncbi:MAG TPA: wax ester/triacylglycerol synthase domain-containing protein [Actinomycetospora sp.]|nr:wax ester/triacylglycerol synthase domain-containing protein [Actinomycetospora sp.]
MDRWASGIDTAWLQLEQPTNRMVVHGVLFCDGPLDVEAIRDRVARRWVAVYPGLRQRPTWPAGGLGPVRWVDHEPDLTAHIGTVALEAPGDDAALARHVGALMSRPLPTDRPWWAMHVVSGYRGAGRDTEQTGQHADRGAAPGDTAVLVSIHHGLADGVALNHLFHALADDPPGTDEGTPVAYAAPPKHRRGVRDVRLVRREVPQRLARLGRTIARWPSPEGRRELAATGSAIGRSTALIVHPPGEAETALQGELGTEKAARWTQAVDLDAVKAVGKEHGASVNDVLCGAIAGALREFLGDGTPRLRAVMPTNLRRLDRPVSHWLGNEFGLVLPTIPTDEPDPGRRVERVHHVMSSIKRTNQALATFIGIAAAGHGRPTWTQNLVRRYAEAASLIITNVPGPVRELEIAGTRVRDLLFWVPCSGQLALGVSILSYAGRVRLGVAADTGVLGGEEGVDRFAAALEGQFARL